MENSTTNRDESTLFLETLLGDGLPPGLFAHVWQPMEDGTDWVRTVEEAERGVNRNGRHDVYFGAGLVGKRGPRNRRIRIETAIGLLGLPVDVDIVDESAHKQKALPPDEEAALALLREVEVPPTLVIHSGHGIQAWWVFQEPWVFENEGREQAIRLGVAWQAHVNKLAAAHGWKLDSVGDLARLMRVPGTTNTKNREKFVPARLLQRGGTRYGPKELADLCREDEQNYDRRAHPDDGADDIDSRRFRKNHPCPVCGGHAYLPSGKGVRCWGFMSRDGDVAFCTREEYAGDLPPITTRLGAVVYAHKLLKTRTLVLCPIADIEAERTEWLFEGYIPNGELSALAGAGGAGKTSLALSIAVTKAGGLSLSNGASADVTGPIGVLYMTTENHPAKVLRPRFEAEALRQTGGDKKATADIMRRIFIERGVVTLPDGKTMGQDLEEAAQHPESVVLPRDTDAVRSAIRDHDIGLVIIDPVISFSERELDVLNPADMRKLLDPLALLAQEENISVWVLLHFTKAVGSAVVLRISMSRQLTDTARAVSVVLEDPNSQGARWLAFVKGNLGVDPSAYSFTIDVVQHPSFLNALSAVVFWHDTRPLKADGLERALNDDYVKQQMKDPFSAQRQEKMQRQSPATYDAVMDLARKLFALRDSGAEVVTSDDLTGWQDELGYNDTTWSKARGILHVKTAKAKPNEPYTQRLDDPKLDWLNNRPS